MYAIAIPATVPMNVNNGSAYSPVRMNIAPMKGTRKIGGKQKATSRANGFGAPWLRLAEPSVVALIVPVTGGLIGMSWRLDCFG